MKNDAIHLTPIQERAQKLSIIAMIVMIIGSVGLDQVTKYVAESNLMVWENPENLKEYRGRRSPVMDIGELSADQNDPSFFLAFSFNYVRNQGAAWGFLSDWDDAYRIPFFYLVTLVAVCIIFMYLKTTPLSHRLARFTLALILSGALGNFADRIVRGYVVDFLDFRWVFPLPFHVKINIDFFPDFLGFLNMNIDSIAWAYNFPNFNWADSAITVGVILLIYDMIVLEYLRKKELSADNSPVVDGEVRRAKTG
ncbi:MAG: signal peptidase II [Oligoflexales bacterium]|nr:signal peptidase II [Oligoflexales bacterium]